MRKFLADRVLDLTDWTERAHVRLRAWTDRALDALYDLVH